jgi:hypothetical protein
VQAYGPHVMWYRAASSHVRREWLHNELPASSDASLLWCSGEWKNEEWWRVDVLGLSAERSPVLTACLVLHFHALTHKNSLLRTRAATRAMMAPFCPRCG